MSLHSRSTGPPVESATDLAGVHWPCHGQRLNTGEIGILWIYVTFGTLQLYVCGYTR